MGTPPYTGEQWRILLPARAVTLGHLKRVDRNLSRGGESAEGALVRLKDAEPKPDAMVRIMRGHLGTPD
jgi:hypothetical protein